MLLLLVEVDVEQQQNQEADVREPQEVMVIAGNMGDEKEDL